MPTRKFVLSGVYLSALVACAPPNLADYRPIVDPSTANMPKFESDLVQCRSIAVEARTNYERQASEQAMTGLLVGAVTGAVVGSAVGSGSSYRGELTAYGAASGAAAGAASSANSQELARFGPNRIIDRCMVNRGHVLLNDLGLGTN
jgi:uncharacterized protein YcfJ